MLGIPCLPRVKVTSHTRFLVNFTLFISLVLLTFLLSGSTNPAFAVKEMYLLKLSYEGGLTSEPASVEPTKPPKPAKPEKGTGPNLGDLFGLTEDGKSIRRREANHKPAPPPTWSSDFYNPASEVTEIIYGHFYQPTIKNNGHDTDEYTWLGEREDHTSGLRSPAPPVAISKGGLKDLMNEFIETSENLHLDIYIGYFGYCVSSNSSTVRCLKKRPKTTDSIKQTLFPDDNTATNTSLTFEDDPQDLLGLGLSLQHAVSSVPLIIGMFFVGCAWLTSIYITLFKRGKRGLDRTSNAVGGTSVGINKIADKITFFLLLPGIVLSLISVAVINVAADIAEEILNGAEAGGIEDDEGVSVGIVGLKGTPGYRAIVVGSSAVVLICLVAIGIVVGLGVWNKRGRDDDDADPDTTKHYGNTLPHHPEPSVFGKQIREKFNLPSANSNASSGQPNPPPPSPVLKISRPIHIPVQYGSTQPNKPAPTLAQKVVEIPPDQEFREAEQYFKRNPGTKLNPWAESSERVSTDGVERNKTTRYPGQGSENSYDRRRRGSLESQIDRREGGREAGRARKGSELREWV